jgi:hypothetical protein
MKSTKMVLEMGLIQKGRGSAERAEPLDPMYVEFVLKPRLSLSKKSLLAAFAFEGARIASQILVDVISNLKGSG